MDASRILGLVYAAHWSGSVKFSRVMTVRMMPVTPPGSGWRWRRSMLDQLRERTEQDAQMEAAVRP